MKQAKEKALNSRKYIRASVKGQVLLHNESKLLVAPLNNLSEGGVFVNGVTSLPEGSLVKLVIRSEFFKEPIQAEGKIIRIEKKERKGSAIQFTGMSVENLTDIKSSVLKAKKKEALNSLQDE
jgi:hypothetical protein